MQGSAETNNRAAEQSDEKTAEQVQAEFDALVGEYAEEFAECFAGLYAYEDETETHYIIWANDVVMMDVRDREGIEIDKITSGEWGGNTYSCGYIVHVPKDIFSSQQVEKMKGVGDF